MPGEDREWAEEVRSELADLHRRALEAYGTSALEPGGTGAGRALVRLEPYRESCYRLLMTALARQSNPAPRRRLADELGIAPSQSTQSLHLELLGYPSRLT